CSAPERRERVGPALVGAHVVHVAAVGVVERPGRARLLLEAAQRLFALWAGPENLDGDVAVQLAIAGDENASHGATAQLALDLVSIVEPRQPVILVMQGRLGVLVWRAGHAMPPSEHARRDRAASSS